MRRRRLEAGGRWLVLAATLAVAAGAPGTAAADATSLRDAPPDCVVATGRGFTLTKADAEKLRSSQSPAPSLAAATRLALDALLAQWLADENVEPMPPKERLRRYRALMIETVGRGGIEDAVEVFGAAREALGVQPGPCYAALE